MGSLLPGWDRKKHGRIPKAMRDFEEPSKIPTSPRGVPTKATPQPITGPPMLSRASCPPSLHGTISVAPVHGKLNETTSMRAPPGERPKLARTSLSLSTSPRGRGSMGTTSSPRAPTSPFVVSSPANNLFNRLLESKEPEDKDSHWCDRFDSSALNQRPDAPKDLEEWRHGSFAPDDPMHSMHILDVESPKSPGGR